MTRPQSSEALSPQQSLFAFEMGLIVKVSGVRGTFRVIGANRDGSIQVYGATRQQFRSFLAAEIQPIKVSGKHAKRSGVASPAEAAGDQPSIVEQV